jgi:hypothetical protein
VLLSTLREHGESLTLRELSLKTAIKIEDIISTLQFLGMIKFWKGHHVIAVSQSQVDHYLAEHSRPKCLAKTECLHWVPRSQRAKVASPKS